MIGGLRGGPTAAAILSATGSPCKHRHHHHHRCRRRHHRHHVMQVELLRNFEAIVLDAENLNQVACAMDAVGVLTAEDRDQWARCRAKLCAISPKNAEVLKLVDTALFVVCLDDCEPETLDDRAANMLHGSYVLQSCNVCRGRKKLQC